MLRKETIATVFSILVFGFVFGQAQDIKFGYINKMGDHPWFVAEVEGAKAKADELGIELLWSKMSSSTPTLPLPA